jgi:hypothetical protein
MDVFWHRSCIYHDNYSKSLIKISVKGDLIMKKTILAVIMALQLLFIAGYQTADASYSIEIMPGGQIDDSAFTNVIFDVVFHPDAGGSTLGNWVFNLYYDPVELSLVSANVGSLPSPLWANGQGFPTDSSPGGHITNFNGVKIPVFAGDPTVNSDLILASVEFNIASKQPWDGQPDLWFDTGVNQTINVDGQVWYWNASDPSCTPSCTTVITAGDLPDVGTGAPPVVPEPVSSILFVVGGATLGLRRYRNRQKDNV